MKSEYLMLSHTFKPTKYNIAGWFLSEKLDGMRAYWDGGISRGIPAKQIPYANRVKDHRLRVEPIATGLWSRTGKVIHAPDWWLNYLPDIPLDGELWVTRGNFQDLTSIVSRLDGGDGWRRVKYCVFDSPPFLTMFSDRKITVRDYEFTTNGSMDWYHHNHSGSVRSTSVKWTFEMVQRWLKCLDLGPIVILIDQERLSFSHFEAVKTVEERLRDAPITGAEGVMLRKHSSFWVPGRSHTSLKYKPWNDDEAIVTGFTTGRETDKGSKLLGMIGALIVNYQEKRLELSGLTDQERTFNEPWMRQWAWQHPGKDVPENFEGSHFKVGDTITFRYRELSDDGIPKEARYQRKRP